MSKLFKLKDWLTLEEAANHMSLMLGESVKLADIYRLALDKHITLTANFINGTQASKGKFVTTEDVEFITIENHFVTNEKLEKPYSMPSKHEVYISENKWVRMDSKVVSVRGLWDLTMLGAEALDIEHYYQQETSGLEVTLTCLEGTLLQQGDVLCQLQTDFDNNEFQPGSKAAEQKLERYISSNELTDVEIEKLRDEYKADRKEFLGGKSELERRPSYFPSGGLDDHDYVLVLRTEEVNRFLSSLEDVHKTKRTRTPEPSLIDSLGLMAWILSKKIHKLDRNGRPNASQIKNAIEIAIDELDLNSEDYKVLTSNLDKDITMALNQLKDKIDLSK